jgi:branched-chain amino acid transport system ATP-binding protein
MPKLVIDGLRVTYGRILGTDGVDLALEPGETLALVGANGAGKSSTLKAVLGMASYAEGRVLLDGADLKGLKPSEVVRRGIAYAPEGRRLFPQLSVLDNLKVGAISRDARELPERLARIYRYFPLLEERAQQRAASLSGGEQQMVAIGRALMARPSVLMLDEPSLGLAPVIVERIGAILEEIQAEEGLAILLAEQNAAWALALARRAVILDRGRVSMAASAAALLDDPSVRRAYLGV